MKKKDAITINEEDEWEAELFVVQMKEWMKRCHMKNRCPGAKLFTHLLAQDKKIKRLECEIVRIREYPDET